MIAGILLGIYLLGMMPFGLYWMTSFQSSTWDSDVYVPLMLSVLWPLLLVPCLVIHARRSVEGL